MAIAGCPPDPPFPTFALRLGLALPVLRGIWARVSQESRVHINVPRGSAPSPLTALRLEDENRKLKQLVGELSLDNQGLTYLLGKKF